VELIIPLSIIIISPLLCVIISHWGRWQRVPLWEKFEYYNKDGIFVQIWTNLTNGEQIKVYHTPDNSREKEMTWQWKIDQYNEDLKQRKSNTKVLTKQEQKRRCLYFQSSGAFGKYIISVYVPKILTNPNPMVPLWAKGTNTSVRQGGRIVNDERWFNLKGEYRFTDFYKKKAEGPMYCYTMKNIIDHPPEARTALAASYIEDGAIDIHAKIPLSEVKLTRIPNDQVVDSEFDDDYGKYNHQGQKVPSWIWTVFPSMTGIFLIFGLIALPMEGGIPFGIGLFILWCIGMYKNAEYKDRINK